MYVYACMHANMHGCMDARMVEVWRFGGMDVCVCCWLVLVPTLGLGSSNVIEKTYVTNILALQH